MKKMLFSLLATLTVIFALPANAQAAGFYMGYNSGCGSCYSQPRFVNYPYSTAYSNQYSNYAAPLHSVQLNNSYYSNYRYSYPYQNTTRWMPYQPAYTYPILNSIATNPWGAYRSVYSGNYYSNGSSGISRPQYYTTGSYTEPFVAAQPRYTGGTFTSPMTPSYGGGSYTQPLTSNINTGGSATQELRAPSYTGGMYTESLPAGAGGLRGGSFVEPLPDLSSGYQGGSFNEPL